MRESQVGAPGLSVGVLIIGSLYWDLSEHRKTWRANRLNLTLEQSVRVPIRYGRKSNSRGQSYTMVFSRGLDADQLGHAIVIPCCRPVRDTRDLLDEAAHLWTAETPEGKNQTRRISARPQRSEPPWGCVALVENPQRRLAPELSEAWVARVSIEGGYGRMHSACGEPAAVDANGFLDIPWPKTVNGRALDCDVLLATAPNPTLVDDERYADSQEIADAWNTRDGRTHIDYFCKNRAHGIKTFQDEWIQERLQELWR